MDNQGTAQTMPPVEISVVVPCYNCADTIADALRALRSQDLTLPYEIIVVNNNSSDRSCEIVASFADVKLVHETQTQNAAATRNCGVRHATGEIIAFIDADCVAAPDWLSRGVAALGQCDRIGGRVTVRPISPQSNAVELLDTLYSFSQQRLVDKYQAAMTGNAMVKRQVFQSVGGFNINFFELEDIEFGRRAAAAGHGIAYAPDCQVFHPARHTFRTLWRKSVRNGRGSFTMCNAEPAWAGRWGWKHPLRSVKILLSSRTLYWDNLPFNAAQLKRWQRALIFIYKVLGIQLPEAWGYVRYWLEHGFHHRAPDRVASPAAGVPKSVR